jgi:hypothetical protein
MLQRTLMGSRPSRNARALFAAMAILLPINAEYAAGSLLDEPSTKKTWDFENDEPGKIANGFTNEVGRWEVSEVGKNRVLAQKAKNSDATFNVALVQKTS